MRMVEEVPSAKQRKPNIKSGCNLECLSFYRIYKKDKKLCTYDFRVNRKDVISSDRFKHLEESGWKQC